MIGETTFILEADRVPGRIIYVVQVFEQRGDTLVAGDREVTTRDAAEARARMLAAKAAGSVVIRFQDEPNGVRSATYIAAFGDVPEPYVEMRA